MTPAQERILTILAKTGGWTCNRGIWIHGGEYSSIAPLERMGFVEVRTIIDRKGYEQKEVRLLPENEKSKAYMLIHNLYKSTK